jgi:hypothetical protein
MGKAIINASKGEGEYSVTVLYSTAYMDAKVERIDAEIESLNGVKDGLLQQVQIAENALSAAKAEMNAAMNSSEPDMARVRRLVYAVNSATMKLSAVSADVGRVELRIAALEKEKEALDKDVPSEKTTSAWCADLTDDLSGEVGTIELGRSEDADVLIIKPGYSDASYSESEDGSMTAVMGMSPAAAVYNYAALPGAAKWKPRYRLGTASNIDKAADTMTVTLDNLEIAGLDCNAQETLTGVAVQYMSCNAGVFVDGDKVVIDFNGEGPVVIGFESSPRSCTGFYLRPTIDGRSLETGGQKFYLKFTRSNGETHETETRSVAGGQDQIRHQYCGPYDISSWDRISDVEVWMKADRDSSRATENVGAMFEYYEEDTNGELAVWGIYTRAKAGYSTLAVSSDKEEIPFKGETGTYYLALYEYSTSIEAVNARAEQDWEGTSEILHKVEKLATVNHITAIKKSFTAANFLAAVGSEDLIYNWDTEEFENNPSVCSVSLDFGLKRNFNSRYEDYLYVDLLSPYVSMLAMWSAHQFDTKKGYGSTFPTINSHIVVPEDGAVGLESKWFVHVKRNPWFNALTGAGSRCYYPADGVWVGMGAGSFVAPTHDKDLDLLSVPVSVIMAGDNGQITNAQQFPLDFTLTRQHGNAWRAESLYSEQDELCEWQENVIAPVDDVHLKWSVDIEDLPENYY